MNKNSTLSKWLATHSHLSRRKATNAIKSGQVSVNGHIETKPYTTIRPDADRVRVNGKPIKAQLPLEYYLLNKPAGYVSAAVTDSSGAPPVTDLIPSSSRLYPVGRLDIDSEGLLILTSDGDLTYRLTHPKFHVEKTYRVTVAGRLTASKITQLEKGIKLGDAQTSPAHISDIDYQPNATTFTLTLTQGLNRQIRRMCAAVDVHVIRLVRIGFHQLQLENIQPGQYRPLTNSEVNSLKQALK